MKNALKTLLSSLSVNAHTRKHEWRELQSDTGKYLLEEDGVKVLVLGEEKKIQIEISNDALDLGPALERVIENVSKQIRLEAARKR